MSNLPDQKSTIHLKYFERFIFIYTFSWFIFSYIQFTYFFKFFAFGERNDERILYFKIALSGSRDVQNIIQIGNDIQRMKSPVVEQFNKLPNLYFKEWERSRENADPNIRPAKYKIQNKRGKIPFS